MPIVVRRLPLVVRLLGVPVAAIVVYAMIDQRGIAMGVVAAVVYVPLALSMLAWDRTSAWGRAHPFLDSLIQLPVVFVGLALVTSLPLWVCAAVGLTLGALLVAFAAYLRRRRVSAAS
jgi:hypothetical protein